MWQVLKLLVACVLLVIGVQPYHPPEGLAEYEQMLDSCVQQEGATAADRDEVMHRLVPSTTTGGCLYTCVMERIGVIVEGSFSPDGAGAVAYQRTKNEARREEARAVAMDCASVKADNRCEMAMLIVDCTSKAAAARGLNPNGVLD